MNVHVDPRDAGFGGILAKLKEMGLTAYRQNFLWTWVEQNKSERAIGPQLGKLERLINDAKNNGTDPLLVLSYGNPFYTGRGFPLTPEAQDAFVAYAESVARHFKGVVRRYEVWNEWNIGLGTSPRTRGDPAAYASLLAKVHASLKAIDPEIVVIGGAVSGADERWLTQMLSAGGVNTLDGVSAHPYINPDVPEKVIDWVDAVEPRFSRLAGGREIPLYLTEIGWPTHTGDKGVTPEVAADFLTRLYLLAATRVFVKGVWWYDLWDDGPDPKAKEQNFGLYHMDRSPKPAACAMTEVQKILKSYKPVSGERQAGGIWVAKFSDGKQSLYGIWTQDQDRRSDLTVVSGSQNATLTARGICKDINVRGNGTSSISATLTGSPILILTTAENVTIRR